jgi:hypothetical protein
MLFHPKEKRVVQKTRWITVLVLWLAAPASLLAQAAPQVVDTKNDASLDAQQERRALRSLMKIVEKEIIHGGRHAGRQIRVCPH